MFSRSEQVSALQSAHVLCFLLFVSSLMDLVHGSRALSSAAILQPPSSDTSFPIIAIAVIGILATTLLLISYYIFLINCCLNWHCIDLLRRFSLSRGRNQDDPQMPYSPAPEPRGLHESVIRSIPIFRFQGKRDFCECPVCLNKFQVDEKLRIIPNCSHAFHIDYVDVWLQSNANCPLCRTSVSSAPPQDPHPLIESSVGGDEDFVVMEFGSLVSDGSTNGSFRGRVNKVTSMGDECIDIRGDKDEQFRIQPLRRSISMDSSADRQLFLAVQEIVGSEVCCSTSGRLKRSFFSFGQGNRGS